MFRHRKPTADDPQPQPAQTARVPPAMLAARRRKETLLPEITQLALEGHPSQAIADKLGMPKRTVNYWLQEENELRKFGQEQTVGGGKKPGAEQNVCGLNDPIATNSELGETRQEKSPRKYPQSLFSGKFGQEPTVGMVISDTLWAETPFSETQNVNCGYAIKGGSAKHGDMDRLRTYPTLRE